MLVEGLWKVVARFYGRMWPQNMGSYRKAVAGGTGMGERCGIRHMSHVVNLGCLETFHAGNFTEVSSL